MPFEMSYDLNAFPNALGLGAPDKMPSDSKNTLRFVYLSIAVH